MSSDVSSPFKNTELGRGYFKVIKGNLFVLTDAKQMRILAFVDKSTQEACYFTALKIYN
jgi:hypothetical protein